MLNKIKNFFKGIKKSIVDDYNDPAPGQEFVDELYDSLLQISESDKKFKEDVKALEEKIMEELKSFAIKEVVSIVNDDRIILTEENFRNELFVDLYFDNVVKISKMFEYLEFLNIKVAKEIFKTLSTDSKNLIKDKGRDILNKKLFDLDEENIYEEDNYDDDDEDYYEDEYDEE